MRVDLVSGEEVLKPESHESGVGRAWPNQFDLIIGRGGHTDVKLQSAGLSKLKRSGVQINLQACNVGDVFSEESAGLDYTFPGLPRVVEFDTAIAGQEGLFESADVVRKTLEPKGYSPDSE